MQKLKGAARLCESAPAGVMGGGGTGGQADLSLLGVLCWLCSALQDKKKAAEAAQKSAAAQDGSNGGDSAMAVDGAPAESVFTLKKGGAGKRKDRQNAAQLRVQKDIGCVWAVGA